MHAMLNRDGVTLALATNPVVQCKVSSLPAACCHRKRADCIPHHLPRRKDLLGMFGAKVFAVLVGHDNFPNPASVMPTARNPKPTFSSVNPEAALFPRYALEHRRCHTSSSFTKKHMKCKRWKKIFSMPWNNVTYFAAPHDGATT